MGWYLGSVDRVKVRKKQQAKVIVFVKMVDKFEKDFFTDVWKVQVLCPSISSRNIWRILDFKVL